MEIFKKSKKSICHKCSNIESVCDLVTWKTCGTDSKEKVSFVEKCDMFNKKLGSKKEYKSQEIKTTHEIDTRVEMIGGGHEE